MHAGSEIGLRKWDLPQQEGVAGFFMLFSLSLSI